MAQESKHKFKAVYAQLRSAFEGGDYVVGDLLPREEELCGDLGVGRFTLREAMQRLENEGFVERKRRLGTRLVSARPRQTFREATVTPSEIFEFTRNTKIDFDEVSVVRADSALARMLGCDELRAWHHLRGLRCDVAEDEPIGVMDLYIDADRFSIPRDLDFGGGPVYEWLEREHDVTLASLSQDISAVQLTAGQASKLDDVAGTPALCIVRRYFDDNKRIFQISRTIHRSRDFVYNVQTSVS